jgi:internalin A
VFDIGHVYIFHPPSADLAQRLADLRGLDTLHLSIKHGFDDDAWRALLRCRQVVNLRLDRDQIGSVRPLRGLASLNQLHSLTVDGGEITVEDARAIAGLRNLRELTLDLVSVTDESLQPFSQLKKLESFRLTHRGTGRNTTASGIAFFNRLANLRTLGLGRLESLDDQVFSQLETMTQLESLNLEQAAITGSEIERLTRLPKLRELILAGTKVDDATMQKLSELTQLDSLDIAYTKVTDAGLKHVGSMKNLRLLYISGNKITEAGTAEIARLSQLQYLFIGNAELHDEALIELQKLTELRTIWMGGNRVTAEGIAKFKAALPKCDVQAN